jgi:heme/copper-type cytochrome/quinol oxidase subunit 2
MKGKERRLLLFSAALATLAALAFLLPAEALAQCPLCRAGLMNGGDRTARTMNLAIIVLLIPPVSIFCTIFAVAYRRRKGDGDDDDSTES